MTKTPTILFASGKYVTDKANFSIGKNSTRWGDTPNLCIDADDEARAKLFAAAPDMAEALKFYADPKNYQSYVGHDPWINEDRGEKARAALAKAGVES